MLSIEQCATLACLLDVTAPKPGNVHRGADFADTTFFDFAASAVAIGPAMRHAKNRGVGKTVLAAIQATREVTRRNTNLGIVLLLAPLAKVPLEADLKTGVRDVLQSLTSEDAEHVFAAIRLAKPGGLRTSAKFDVHRAPPASLLAAMRQSADRDLVALQYVSGFALVCDEICPQLVVNCAEQGLIPGIVHTFVTLMSQHPDSLIARKLGDNVARQAQVRAQQALQSGPPGSEPHSECLADLDFWLRSDGNRRNPGTLADLTTAALFASIRDQKIELKTNG